MRNLATAIVVGAVGVAAVLALDGAAYAAPTNDLIGTHAYCTLADPEFMIQWGGAKVTHTPGTEKFSATHSAPGWNAPYLTAGYNASLNSAMCNARRAADGQHHFTSPVVPAPIGTQFSGTLNIKVSDFHGDTGWDIWLTDDPGEYTYADMIHNGGMATTELMVWTDTSPHYRGSTRFRGVPGQWSMHGGPAKGQYGTWNRVYVIPDTPKNDQSIDLTSIIAAVKRHYTVMARTNTIEAIDGGAEFTRGSVSVQGYALTTRAPATAKPAPPKAPAKPAPPKAPAKRVPPKVPAKRVPVRPLPNVKGKALGPAIRDVRRAGFKHLTWTRGLRPSAVVYAETPAAHGKYTLATHVVLRARANPRRRT